MGTHIKRDQTLQKWPSKQRIVSDLYEYCFVKCNGFPFRAMNSVNLAIYYVCIKHIIFLSNTGEWKMTKYEISRLTENANISACLDLPCFKITCDTDTFFILIEFYCLRTEVPVLWRIHDDVIKWKHFPRYWPFLRGIHRSRWILLTKASDAELWCFLWSAHV